ncbi:hypothetical protein [Amycolatopsis sp. NBC_00438]|uniref:hypothetical protein n=1 Tax=Amycolatopsis sp. NBC_00438 TaxID=2903558 RepID=UPI002E20A3FA
MRSRSDRERVEEVPAKVALRLLAKRRDGELIQFLRRTIESPSGGYGSVLGCLIGPTASLPAGTPELRARAIWGLIVDEVGRLGSALEPRDHFVLLAAFRLPPVPGGGEWKSTLRDRFRQLARIPGVFGDPPPTTETPMHQAWSRALGMLCDCVGRKLEHVEGEAWLRYVEVGRTADGGDSSGCRPPSEGAQPVFLERAIVTVIMHRRTALRRITERHVIARRDGVDGYDVHAMIGRTESSPTSR